MRDPDLTDVEQRRYRRLRYRFQTSCQTLPKHCVLRHLRPPLDRRLRSCCACALSFSPQDLTTYKPLGLVSFAILEAAWCKTTHTSMFAIVETIPFDVSCWPLGFGV